MRSFCLSADIAELGTVHTLDAVRTGRVPAAGDVGVTWDKLVIRYGINRFEKTGL